MTTRRWGPALFAALLLSGIALGAPPKLTIPAEVKPAGQYVDFVPDTDAVSITYVGLDGIDPVPSRRLAEKTAFLLDTYGKPAKKYRFAAVASSKDGEQTRADFVVIIGNPVDPPVDQPLPITDPKPPVTPVPSSKLFFVVVRKDGPADFSFTESMSLPAWGELTKAGHTYKEYGITDARKLFTSDAIWSKAVDGATTPFVITLQNDPNGKTSSLVKKAVPLPSQNDGVLELAKGVK